MMDILVAALLIAVIGLLVLLFRRPPVNNTIFPDLGHTTLLNGEEKNNPCI